MEKASREVVESPAQSEILGQGIAAIAGVFAVGLLALVSVTIFAVKLGEHIMNYGS